MISVLKYNSIFVINKARKIHFNILRNKIYHDWWWFKTGILHVTCANKNLFYVFYCLFISGNIGIHISDTISREFYFTFCSDKVYTLTIILLFKHAVIHIKRLHRHDRISLLFSENGFCVIIANGISPSNHNFLAIQQFIFPPSK